MTTPSTKAAFRRRCQLAIDQGRPVMLYAPHCPQGTLLQLVKVRSADIVALATNGPNAGKNVYLGMDAYGAITNNGETWTIGTLRSAPVLLLTYVFQE